MRAEQSAAGVTMGWSAAWDSIMLQFAGVDPSLLEQFWQTRLEVCVSVAGPCTHRGCQKRQRRSWPFRMITNGIFSWRSGIFGPGGLETKLCLRDGALGRTRLRETTKKLVLQSSTWSVWSWLWRGFECLQSWLVVSQTFACCNCIEKQVPLALCGLVKEIWQVELEVMSVSKWQCPGTCQQFCSDAVWTHTFFCLKPSGSLSCCSSCTPASCCLFVPLSVTANCSSSYALSIVCLNHSISVSKWNCQHPSECFKDLCCNLSFVQATCWLEIILDSMNRPQLKARHSKITMILPLLLSEKLLLGVPTCVSQSWWQKRWAKEKEIEKWQRCLSMFVPTKSTEWSAGWDINKWRWIMAIGICCFVPQQDTQKGRRIVWLWATFRDRWFRNPSSNANDGKCLLLIFFVSTEMKVQMMDLPKTFGICLWLGHQFWWWT